MAAIQKLLTTHEQDYGRFLQRLRRAREEAGLKQEEVAEMLGRTQYWVSRRETGDTRVDFVELVAFAKAYDKPLEFFADWGG